MFVSKMLQLLDNKKIPYEIVKFSPGVCDKTARYQNVQNGIEFTEWHQLSRDGSQMIALLSANYGQNVDQIKRSLKAQKLGLSRLDLAQQVDFHEQALILDRTISDIDTPILIPIDHQMQSPSYLKVSSADVASTWPVQIHDFSLTPAYKAKVCEVSPESMRSKFELMPNCFFGISLENSNFVRARLLASLEWISNRFKKCTILIGDSIHRITLESNYKMEPRQARNHAIYLGQKYLNDEKTSFERFRSKCQFEYVFCSEIQSDADYPLIHKNLTQLFQKDEAFRSSVESFGKAYHAKRRETIPDAEWNHLIDASCRYFIEEFAIFACLYRRDLPVMVYPGSFSTLSEIAAGMHPEAPQELQKLTVVSLHIKKR